MCKVRSKVFSFDFSSIPVSRINWYIASSPAIVSPQSAWEFQCTKRDGHKTVKRRVNPSPRKIVRNFLRWKTITRMRKKSTKRHLTLSKMTNWKLCNGNRKKLHEFNKPSKLGAKRIVKFILTWSIPWEYWKNFAHLKIHKSSSVTRFIQKILHEISRSTWLDKLVFHYIRSTFLCSSIYSFCYCGKAELWEAKVCECEMKKAFK